MTDQKHAETLLEGTVDAAHAGVRLDQALAGLFPDYSRSRLQAWIREGRVSVNGEPRRPRDKVEAGDRLLLRAVHRAMGGVAGALVQHADKGSAANDTTWCRGGA